MTDLRNLIAKMDSILTEDEFLIEAQDYGSMFNDYFKVLKQLEAKYPSVKSYIEKEKQAIDSVVTKAKQKLKKNDRVVWFLRYYKIGRAMGASDVSGRWSLPRALSADMTEKNNEAPENAKIFGPGADYDNLADACFAASRPVLEYYKKIVADYANKSKEDEVQVKIDSHNICADVESNLTDLEHYFSLPIPEIQNMVFAYQLPRIVMNNFNELEDEWKARAKQTFEHDPKDGKIIIKFPDGFFWVMLDRGSCRKEGEVMGHCGNVPSERSGDRLLSLRKLIKEGDRTLVRPSLTFILDRNDMLGEMKGRNNQKPDAKYHPYIVELLKSNYISGIKGGGYMPQNNFSMNDLDDETREELEAEKPELAGLLGVYEKYGVKDRRFIDKLNYTVDSLPARLGYLDISDDHKEVTVETWQDLGRFASDIGDDVFSFFYDVYDGSKDATDLDDIENFADDDIFELIDGLHEDDYASLMKRLDMPVIAHNKRGYRMNVYKAAREFQLHPALMEILTAAIARSKSIELEVRKNAKQILERFIDVGWYFDINSVYVKLDEADPLNGPVSLNISMYDYVHILSADSEGDDGYDDWSYAHQSAEYEGWSRYGEYTNDQRSEKDLPSDTRRDEKFKELKDSLMLTDNVNFRDFSQRFARMANL